MDKKIFFLIIPILLVVFFIKFIHKDHKDSTQIDQILPQSSLPKEAFQSAMPKFDHIVVIVMENKGSDNIINNPSAPFINSLIKKYSLANNYYAISHPSLPNYLALIGGSTFGATSDCENCYQNSKNLIDNLENAHKSWKAYMESMPSPCFVGSHNPYAMKHDPFIYFNDIRSDQNRCQNIVPLTNLNADLSDPNKASSFIWITPNLCHDMHDCSISEGDSWLKGEVGQILDSPIFTSQNSLLVITWDEAEGNGANKIPTLLIGPYVKKNFISDQSYTHYSLLHTIEKIWGLPSLTQNDAQAPTMDEFFQ